MTYYAKPVNPWRWQDQLSFSQAVDVAAADHVVYCAGQTSVDGEGKVLHAGDMAAQLAQAFDNLETVLAQAGLTLANVVRLNYYVTDIPAFFAAAAIVAARLQTALDASRRPFSSPACKPAGTLLGVASLFHPDAMVEIEATAVA